MGRYRQKLWTFEHGLDKLFLFIHRVIYMFADQDLTVEQALHQLSRLVYDELPALMKGQYNDGSGKVCCNIL